MKNGDFHWFSIVMLVYQEGIIMVYQQLIPPDFLEYHLSLIIQM